MLKSSPAKLEYARKYYRAHLVCDKQARRQLEEEESVWGPGLDAKCQTCGQRLARIEMEPFSSAIFEICPDLHRHAMKRRGVVFEGGVT